MRSECSSGRGVPEPARKLLNWQMTTFKLGKIICMLKVLGAIVPKRGVMLPTSTSKFTAQWQGPYQVVKPVGKVNYLIDMCTQKKQKWIFHVNLLRKWQVPESTGYLRQHATEDENDEFPDWRGGNVSSSTFGDQLSSTQTKELDEVLREFTDVLCAKPGWTNLIVHTIHAECKPIQQAAYRIPHAYREAVLKELQEMEESGIIEPSCSEWASPIVVAKKKDNSIRLCVDYWKLNVATPMDAYPMPRVDELLDKVGKATSCFHFGLG